MLVYISATFLDLRPHRLAVERAILQLDHQPLGMESYVAADTRPLDVCLKDVERSDVYVAIYAWRYGSKAETAGLSVDGLNFPAEGSVTEYEFAYAMQLKKPRLLFLAAEDAPWPPRQIDAVTGASGGGEQIRPSASAPWPSRSPSSPE